MYVYIYVHAKSMPAADRILTNSGLGNPTLRELQHEDPEADAPLRSPNASA